jgi:hypothetical protein
MKLTYGHSQATYVSMQQVGTMRQSKKWMGLYEYPLTVTGGSCAFLTHLSQPPAEDRGLSDTSLLRGSSRTAHDPPQTSTFLPRALSLKKAELFRRRSWTGVWVKWFAESMIRLLPTQGL